MPAPLRKNAPQLIHEISAALGPAQANAGTGVLGNPGGAGGFLLMAHFVTTVAFDAATITLGIGGFSGGTDILAGQNVKAVGRVDVALPAASAGLYVNPTQVYWTFTLTGGPATVGQVTVWLEYIPQPG